MLTSIKSVGSYVPSGILTNADLEKMVETSDTWIRERTGIHERRIAAVNETATDLAAEAALDALAAAGMRPQDTDLIVCSTSTPDSMFPSVASRVQERLGAQGPAFDVQAACTGFLYAMSVADRFVSGGESKQAIVIGSETLTKILNFKDRGTCVVFGDGAGAVASAPSSNGAGIKSSALGSDGPGGDLIHVAPGADGPDGRARPASGLTNVSSQNALRRPAVASRRRRRRGRPAHLPQVRHLARARPPDRGPRCVLSLRLPLPAARSRASVDAGRTGFVSGRGPVDRGEGRPRLQRLAAVHQADRTEPRHHRCQ